MMNIVGIGEVLWDVFGEQKTLGGAPANFAYHAAQQGVRGNVVSAIGNDELGDETLKILEQKKLFPHLQRVPAPTGTVPITLDKNGVANYAFPPNVAWDYLQMTPELLSLAEQTNAVCFGSLAQRSAGTRAAIYQFLKAVPAGAIKIFDANLRQDFYCDEVLLDSLALATMLKINEDEIGVFKKLLNCVPATNDEFAKKLFEYFENLQHCVLTLGGDGSEIWTANGEHSKLACDKSAPIVDTVGAGDSFTATLVVALLAGTPLADAHAKATRVATFVCSRKGAMPQY